MTVSHSEVNAESVTFADDANYIPDSRPPEIVSRVIDTVKEFQNFCRRLNIQMNVSKTFYMNPEGVDYNIHVDGIKINGSDEQQELKIKRVLNHCYYKPVILENDISVIELQSALNFTSSVQPVGIGIEKELKEVGKNGIFESRLVGCGYIDGQNLETKELQATKQVYTNYKRCQHFGINSGYCFLTKDTVGNSQAYQGDSGVLSIVILEMVTNYLELFYLLVQQSVIKDTLVLPCR